MVVHIGHWAQFITAKVEAASESDDFRKPALTLLLDKPLVYRAGDTGVLMYLEGAKLRVAGTIVIIEYPSFFFICFIGAYACWL
jgi:hypothetical protein